MPIPQENWCRIRQLILERFQSKGSTEKQAVFDRRKMADGGGLIGGLPLAWFHQRFLYDAFLHLYKPKKAIILNGLLVLIPHSVERSAAQRRHGTRFAMPPLQARERA